MKRERKEERKKEIEREGGKERETFRIMQMENMDRLRRIFTLDKKCLAYNAIVNNEAKNDQKIRTERFLFFSHFSFFS